MTRQMPIRHLTVRIREVIAIKARSRVAMMLATLVMASVLSSCSHSVSSDTTWKEKNPTATIIYVVRHAEKLTDKNDPELSSVGQTRAQALAAVLRYEAIDALYSSDYRRTLQTLTPLSDVKSVGISRYDAGDSLALVQRIITDHVGQHVVVAGHSNTVPEIVCLLRSMSTETCAKTPWLEHNDYDRLFVVWRFEDQLPKVLELSY